MWLPKAGAKEEGELVFGDESFRVVRPAVVGLCCTVMYVYLPGLKCTF